MPWHAGGRSALGRRDSANRTFPGVIKILEIDYQELAKSGPPMRKVPCHFITELWFELKENWENFKVANKRHLGHLVLIFWIATSLSILMTC